MNIYTYIHHTHNQRRQPTLALWYSAYIHLFPFGETQLNVTINRTFDLKSTLNKPFNKLVKYNIVFHSAYGLNIYLFVYSIHFNILSTR